MYTHVVQDSALGRSCRSTLLLNSSGLCYESLQLLWSWKIFKHFTVVSMDRREKGDFRRACVLLHNTNSSQGNHQAEKYRIPFWGNSFLSGRLLLAILITNISWVHNYASPSVLYTRCLSWDLHNNHGKSNNLPKATV